MADQEGFSDKQERTLRFLADKLEKLTEEETEALIYMAKRHSMSRFFFKHFKEKISYILVLIAFLVSMREPIIKFLQGLGK